MAESRSTPPSRSLASACKLASEVIAEEMRAAVRGLNHPPLEWDKALELARAVSALDMTRSTRSENATFVHAADAEGKRPRLFYWEEAEDCWCPVMAARVDDIVDVTMLDHMETMTIRFKRENMTDAEFEAIPEG